MARAFPTAGYVIAAIASLGASPVHGHGILTYPPSTRTGGNLAKAGGKKGDCVDCVYEGLWFSQPADIPGPPTNNDEKYRTWYDGCRGAGTNYARLPTTDKCPWRAPGTAPVRGSGCGAAGGGPNPPPHDNGSKPPPGWSQGADGIGQKAVNPTTWQRGYSQYVAFAIVANHGGGYQYRLCPTNGANEQCFQQHYMPFVGNTQWIQVGAGTGKDWGTEIPAVRLSEGTWPPGSTWTVNPIPIKVGEDGKEHKCFPGYPNKDPAPIPGVFGVYPRAWNVVDRVMVPTDLADGDYLLSWRWDGEATSQIWQNCADIKIAGGAWGLYRPNSIKLSNQEVTKCIDLPNADTTNGNKVWLWDCVGTDNQNWEVHDGAVFFKKNPKKCLDLPNGDQTNGNQLQIWDCSGQSNQNWNFDGSARRLYLAGTSKCIDMGGNTDNGAKVVIWDCNGLWQQWWSVLDPFQIVELGSKKCADVSGGKAFPGAKVELWDCNYYDQQLWEFSPGSWTIRYGPNPALCLDLPADKAVKGTYLQLWGCNEQPGQKWGMDDKTKRIYLAQDTTKCIDLPGGDTKSGNQLWLWDCDKAVPWGLYRAKWGHSMDSKEGTMQADNTSGMPRRFTNSSVLV